MTFDLKTALGSIAPTLATMLGGPLAGTAVNALCGALGMPTGSTAADVTAVVQAGMTPDSIAAVRAADQHHLEVLGQQGIDLQKLNADHEAAMATVDASDRDSARKREETVKDWTPMLLAFMVTIGFFGVLGYMLAVGKPKEGGDALLVMLGALGGAWGSVIAYYFGSSAGSRNKDVLLANSTPAGTVPRAGA